MQPFITPKADVPGNFIPFVNEEHTIVATPRIECGSCNFVYNECVSRVVSIYNASQNQERELFTEIIFHQACMKNDDDETNTQTILNLKSVKKILKNSGLSKEKKKAQAAVNEIWTKLSNAGCGKARTKGANPCRIEWNRNFHTAKFFKEVFDSIKS